MSRVLLLLLVVLCILGVGWFGVHEHRQLARALADEQVTTTVLQQEVMDLLTVNQLLRAHVISLHENLSGSAILRDACLRTLAPLQANHTAPPSRIAAKDVRIANDAVVIRISDVIPGIVGPTRSMVPVLDNNTMVLEITPSAPGAIAVGDIIIYALDDDRIIHRVISTGTDADGWYAIVKGDNNPREDPLRVRFSQVRGLVVGIIY
jgi:hypothetical protein